jgi:hypothetical protein
LPSEWKDVLSAWVQGVGFSEILGDRKARDAQRTQTFIQDGIVFRLVWAVEAVRVQATAIKHARADELGDGPAFALTYGVPSIPAALLCQMGFSSRVGALWLARKLSASFTDTDGLLDFLSQHDALLSTADFWESDDVRTLWKNTSSPTNTEYPRPWQHTSFTVPVDWKPGYRPAANSQVRIIAGHARAGTICGTDLVPLGTAQFPFDPHGAALDGSVTRKGTVNISYFGKA